jgi:hypothetical protein
MPVGHEVRAVPMGSGVPVVLMVHEAPDLPFFAVFTEQTAELAAVYG